MPRIARLALPGVPLHVIQRGNNRQACFFQTTDYQYYLDTAFACAKRYQVAIHAYVLMSNHVHLLLTPADKWGFSRMMQLLGATYVRMVNSTYQRTGTLWEGRYKSSLVDSEKYCLACYRYIELNPVRAGMCKAPGEYQWSSYSVNALGHFNPGILAHTQWQELASTEAERYANYRLLFKDEINPDQLEKIRYCVQKGLPTGSNRFIADCKKRRGKKGSLISQPQSIPKIKSRRNVQKGSVQKGSEPFWKALKSLLDASAQKGSEPFWRELKSLLDVCKRALTPSTPPLFFKDEYNCP